MDDAGVMRGSERVGDLPGDRDRVVEREPAVREPIGQRRTFDELEDERFDALVALDAIERGDVGVIERREHLGLALEASQPIAIVGQGGRQHLDRHVAAEPLVVRAVHFTHAADAKQSVHAVGADVPDGGQRGDRSWLSGTSRVEARRSRSSSNSTSRHRPVSSPQASRT